MKVKDLQRKEYLNRINKVIDYIDENISSKFTLDELADVASFSKFHFHRIFSGIMGETLNNYIHRIRIEKAASLLVTNPNKSITEIVIECGFSSSSVFARAFKEIFNVKASEWRERKILEFSKIGQPKSNISEVSDKLDKYFGEVHINKKGSEMKTNVKPTKIEVKEMNEFSVVYLRYIGPYKGDSELFKNLFSRLFTWAGPKGLCNFPETKVISLYHDNPDITDEEKLRVSICLSAPDETTVDGEFGKMKIAAGKYAVASFVLSHPDEYAEAWSYLYTNWLFSSGFQPDDKPTYELYLNSPEEHPENKHIVDIYIPVKPI